MSEIVVSDEHGKKVVSRSGQEVAAPESQSSKLIEVISRVAMDPAADLDKMERLLDMQERIMKREAEMFYFSDMASLQAEMPEITETGILKNNSGVIGTYGKYEDIIRAVKPSLQKYGFSIRFENDSNTPGMISVTGYVSHRGGHSECASISLPFDATGSKNSVQSIGSSISYAKRYVLGMLINITTHGEDDDGAAGGAKPQAKSVSSSTSGGKPKSATEKQLVMLRDKIKKTKTEEAAVCSYYGIDKLEALPIGKVNEVLDFLGKKSA